MGGHGLGVFKRPAILQIRCNGTPSSHRLRSRLKVASTGKASASWAGRVASKVLYTPAKLVYGILGGVTGGAGYALTGGNQQVAETIWRRSLSGDYVITPDMVSGKEPVHFSGPTSIAPPEQLGDEYTHVTYGMYQLRRLSLQVRCLPPMPTLQLRQAIRSIVARA